MGSSAERTDGDEPGPREEDHASAPRWIATILQILIGPLLVAATGFFTENIWAASWLLAPLLLMAVLPTAALRHRDYIALARWRWAGLAGLFLLATAGVMLPALMRPGDLRGYQAEVPRNRLGAERLGDWHYWFRPRTHPSEHLLIVYLDPARELTQARLELARLVDMARIRGARGIGLDFYFTKSTPADRVLCDAIRRSGESLPVFATFGVAHGKQGLLYRQELPSSLAHADLQEGGRGCIDLAHLGHNLGYQAPDGRIRSVPLYFGDRKQWPALGLRVVHHLVETDPVLPENRLLQFIPTAFDIPAVHVRELTANPDILRDRFLLFGVDIPEDTWTTVDGPVPGVEVHAQVVESLLRGQYITRLPLLVSMLGAVVFTLTIAARRNRGERWRYTLLAAGLGTLAIAGAAAICMYAALIWIDIIHAVSALWAWTAIEAVVALVVARRRPAARPATEGT